MRERDLGFPTGPSPNRVEFVKDKQDSFILSKIDLGGGWYQVDTFILDFPFKVLLNLPDRNHPNWVSFWKFKVNGDLSQGMRADICYTFLALEEALEIALLENRRVRAVKNFNTPTPGFLNQRRCYWQNEESFLQIIDFLSLDKYVDRGYSFFPVPEKINYRNQELWGIPTLAWEVGIYFIFSQKQPNIFHLEVLPPCEKNFKRG